MDSSPNPPPKWPYNWIQCLLLTFPIWVNIFHIRFLQQFQCYSDSSFSIHSVQLQSGSPEPKWNWTILTAFSSSHSRSRYGLSTGQGGVCIWQLLVNLNPIIVANVANINQSINHMYTVLLQCWKLLEIVRILRQLVSMQKRNYNIAGSHYVVYSANCIIYII